jgi:hypothetical protein
MMNIAGRKNERQYAKILMYEFEDADGVWEQEEDDWWRWALPVYRRPQASWDLCDNLTRQKIWFAPSAHGDETIDPNGSTFNKWMQCYWDSQAGRWTLIASSGGAGSIIEFVIEPDESSSSLSGTASGSSASSSSAGDDEACANRNNDAPASVRAKVVRRPCGVSRVEQEDDDGYVEVVDSAAGQFLSERQSADIVGKPGFATLLTSSGGGEGGGGSGSGSVDNCEWVITWIDWHVEKQFVTDVIIAGMSISLERANAKVWSYCSLPTETINGTDCEESGSASGSGSASI